MTWRFSAGAAALCLGWAAYAQPNDGTALFRTAVQPILSENCFACHGPDEKVRKAGLRLDQADGAFAPLGSGGAAVVPGDRSASELYRRITSDNPNVVMPPPETHKTLSEADMDVIGRWIDLGAPYAPHWAFEAPRQPEPPAVENTSWPRNAIDHFILARLEREGLQPAQDADRATLLRRVYLDLVGLPPGAEALDAFLIDDRPDAYERVVDGLLASPHYGERWARHWLDLARYADSNGYSIDGPRSIWRYRDWVISALNAGMPFDEFTIHQMAGDLLPDADTESITATGFHRNTMINQEGGVDPEEFRVAAVVDRVNTTATVYLGLTMACAQCHSHKYDPISHEEYFRFYAFFNNDDEVTIEAPDESQIAARAEIQQRISEMQADLNGYLDSTEAAQIAWESALAPRDRAKLSKEQRAAIETPRADRSNKQHAIVRALFQEHDPKALEFTNAIGELRESMPAIPTTMVLRNGQFRRTTRIHAQGDFTQPVGDPLMPGVPGVLHRMPEDADGTRLDLAHWLVDPSNPLTARVTMNRYWQRFFGRGLVETENDFGLQGALPTHPELLDWLATEFVARDWDSKAMHRLIVTSATYRQSSHARPDLRDIDPGNRLLARQSRLRLDAEVIRDTALTVAGTLNPAVGGPSVFPPIPDGVMSLGQQKQIWDVSPGADRYRRGMYTFFWRATPHPSLTVFDAPDATVSCTRRNRSNTPLQALTLLNDEAYYEQARWLAIRVAMEALPNDTERIHYAYRLCVSREPQPGEVSILLNLLENQRRELRAAPEEARLILADAADDHEADPAELAAWTMVARALLNLDEFITRE